MAKCLLKWYVRKWKPNTSKFQIALVCKIFSTVRSNMNSIFVSLIHITFLLVTQILLFVVFSCIRSCLHILPITISIYLYTYMWPLICVWLVVVEKCLNAFFILPRMGGGDYSCECLRISFVYYVSWNFACMFIYVLCIVAFVCGLLIYYIDKYIKHFNNQSYYWNCYS